MAELSIGLRVVYTVYGVGERMMSTKSVFVGLAIVALAVPVGCERVRPEPSAAQQVLQGEEDMTTQVATFAAGCFWGVEETFRQVQGVVATEVGYTGGTVENPTYEEVCSDRTGHAEAVRVTFDPEVVSYKELLTVFWRSHDPTTPNRQGPDVGSQYRSEVFYHTSEQRKIAEKTRAELEASGKYSKRITTRISAAFPFWRAEEYLSLIHI